MEKTQAQIDGERASDSAYNAGVCFFCETPIKPRIGSDGKPVMDRGRPMLGWKGLCKPCSDAHYD